MNKLRFWIGLWGGKTFLFLWKLFHAEKDDRPGMVSVRICEDFLARVAKPKLTIVVTGTNGKTTISNMLAETLKKLGYKVAYNDWGANHNAGQARCLLDAVSIFNKPIKDVAIIEADELISPTNVPRLKPTYLIVNNVSRDSMLRNGNPEYIAERLRRAAEGSPESVVVMCGDDPVSSLVGEANRRVVFGADYLGTNPLDTMVDDYPVCLKCGGKPRYSYRNYRNIGEYKCSNCGFGTPKRDYIVKSHTDETLTVAEKTGAFTYPVPNSAIHNIYNTAAIVSILRDIGEKPEAIAEALESIKPPASREGSEVICGVNLHRKLAKTHNPTAVSTVFENIKKDKSKKLLLMVLDEIFENPRKSETVAWFYDTDYEFLNDESVTKIVLGGDRYLDHKLRMLLAGVPEEKIICIPKHLDVLNYADIRDVETVYIVYDIYTSAEARKVTAEITERIRKERGEEK
ncbi:MAG: DUF1727 domain-containing protein [Clostridia bacterium]|nr:DUF1727 domain-containing protein [Clostridia bacterium]